MGENRVQVPVMEHHEDGSFLKGSLSFHRVTGSDEIRQVFRSYDIPPSPWLFAPDLDPEQVIVLEAFAESSPAGVIAGVCFPRKAFALLRLLFLKSGFRRADHIRSMATAFAGEAGKSEGVDTVCWRYVVEGGRKDIREALIRTLPDVRTESKIIAVSFSMELSRIGLEVPRIFECTEELLLEQGIRVVPLGEAKEELLEQIRAVTEGPDQEAKSLSPLCEGPYDLKNSMIWVKADTGSLCGWMAVRRESADTVEMARNYALPGIRSQGEGITFGAFMMRRLSECYTYGTIKILPENASMLFFVRRFFGAFAREDTVKLLTCNYSRPYECKD